MLNIGIDLGGMSIKAGIVDDSFKIIHSATAPTGADRPDDQIVRDMALLCIRVCEEAGYDINKDIGSIGIGSPGTCDSKNGILTFSPNINFRNTPMRDIMHKYVNVPVYIGNDANVAALGEYKVLDEDVENFIAVTLGTGVGGGIIINRKIYEGKSGAAGEIGHIRVRNNGVKCGCGRYGCWETEASVSGLIRKTKEKMVICPDSLMHEEAAKEGEVSGKTAFIAAKKGDKAAKEVVDEYIDSVGQGICDMINIFQPEILVVGGAISKEGDYLLNPVRELVKSDTYKHPGIQTEVRAAKLGNDAGIIGAALLGE